MQIDIEVQKIVSLLHEAYEIRGNNIAESIKLTQRALELSEENKQPELIAHSLTRLALFHMIKGNYTQSNELSEKAINYYETINDDLGIANARFNIASVYYKTDNFHMGLLNLIECLQIYKKHNDHHNMARVYKSLGTIYEYFGDEIKAISAYEETISHAAMVGDRNMVSNAYNPLSGIYLKKGELTTAMDLAEKAIQIKRETGDTRGYAFSVYARAKVFSVMGEFGLAETDYKESLKIHQNTNELLGTAMTLRKLGQMYLASGQFDKAAETLNEARAFSYKNQVAIIKYKSNYHLYELYKKLDHPGKSLQYLEDYLHEKELVVNNQTLTIIDNFELMNKVEAMKRESELQMERAEMLEKKTKAENLAHIKQDFLSTMSHEIRTPLNAVITIASLLESHATEEDRQLIHSLKFASNNLLLLINDILDFTRLESGKMDLEKRRTPIKNLFENLIKTYSGLALEKNLDLNLTLDDSLHGKYYEMDETRLSQIMVNLIGNAIKYTNQGRINVEVRLIEMDNQTDSIRVSVEDSGIGIQEKDQSLIFESFSQTQDVKTRKHGGSGLGLAIVKKLVELHKSEINLISRPGLGSVFYFDLILEKSMEQVQVTKTLDHNLKGKRILLVEDNQINAMVAGKLLAKWELETKHVANGLLAIEAVSKEAFDCILMDIHMPEMDGFEATKWIRTHENPNKTKPIIALTADITAENEGNFKNYFNVFLRKPIETEKLLENLVKFIK